MLHSFYFPYNSFNPESLSILPVSTIFPSPSPYVAIEVVSVSALDLKFLHKCPLRFFGGGNDPGLDC